MNQQENISGPSEALAEKKRLLLEKRLNRVAPKSATPKASLPKRPPGSKPLASLGQQRIWLLDKLSGNTPSFNVTSSFHIHSKIDHAALETALNKVVERHEVLRSFFSFENSELIQHTENALHLPIERIECMDGESLEEVAQTFVRNPFDLNKLPLLRMALCSKSEKHHILTLSIHDIIFDKWSIKLFWKEFSALYEQELTGSIASLPELPVQYTDFAYWQRKWLDDGEGERQLAYWKKQLENPPPPTPFATDHPYSNEISDGGALERSTLSQATAGRLRELAAEQNASVFMLTLLGFNILLSKYTRTTDLLVSSPVANRRNRETAELIGFFLNTIVIRTDLSGDPTVLEALDQIRKTSLDALTHQDLPPDAIVDEIKPGRVPGRHPLFQTMFVFQREDEGKPRLDLHGCDITPTFIETRTSKFDVCLFVAESPDGMDTTAEYRTDIFDPASMKRLLRHYARLMDDLVEHPEKRISELELLDEEEATSLLGHSHGTLVTQDCPAPVANEIARHASTHPQAIAITGPKREKITYAELEERVTRLAGELVRNGAGANVPIAIYMDPSPSAIIAILATLRAGAAYLPIDPSYPEKRIVAVLQDADPAAIITSARHVAKLEKLTDTPLIDPDIAGCESDQLLQAPDMSSLAYLIYTSGSTGTPKGVMVTQKNLSASTFSRLEYYSVQPEKFLLLSSLAFDSSVAGIFWTLISGGTLVIPTPGSHHDPDMIRRTIEDEHVTTLLCVPGLYREIIETETDRLASLKTAIVAGDSCQNSLAERHHELVPSCALYNEYGPTEATVWCSVAKLNPGQAVGIGSPIPNHQVHVLSPQLDLLPIGIPGELCIAGPGVTNGYLDDDPKTREKFVSVTLPDGRCERIYRTGDQARYLDNGTLEFLGRIDNQLKIRGYRVELGEIEDALDSQPNIAESLVHGIQETVNDQPTTRLVAFLVLRDEKSFDVKTLRNELLAILPPHAVPAQFVALDQFPKLSNGKVDRNALPIPDREGITAPEIVEPADPTEASLVEIWKTILELKHLSTTANFFDLGGTSLQAIRLISKIKETFGSKLSTNRLLESPTIIELARLIGGENQKAGSKNLIRMKQGGAELPAFLVPSGGLEILFYRPLAEFIDDSIPVYGIEPVGFKENETPLENVEEMATHYLNEIRSIFPNGPFRLIGHCFGATIALEMARQCQDLDIEVPVVIALDGQAPRPHGFIPTKGPGLWAKLQEPGLFLSDLRSLTGNPLRRMREQRMMKSGDVDQRTHVLIQRTARLVRKAYENHRTSPYHGRLLVFNCTESENMARHSRHAWRTNASRATIETIDCLHEDILRNPHVQKVAERVNQELLAESRSLAESENE